MACPRCGSETAPVAVPESFRSWAPAATVSVCSTCLTIEPAADDATGSDPDAISDRLPDGDAGVGILLLVDLLDSLATNRADVDAVVAELEAMGADPLLALDRLASDSGLDPAVDLPRRRRQLEQLVL